MRVRSGVVVAVVLVLAGTNSALMQTGRISPDAGGLDADRSVNAEEVILWIHRPK